MLGVDSYRKLNVERRRKMEGKAAMVIKIVGSALFGGFALLFLYVYERLILKPKRQRSKLEKQGIRGPYPSFFLGNIPEIKTIHLNLHQSATAKAEADPIDHDWPSTIFPRLQQWRAEYGVPSISLFLLISSTFVLYFVNFRYPIFVFK